MHYCLIINDFKAGGAQKANIDLIKGLVDYGHSVVIISFEDKIEFDIPTKIPLYYLQKKGEKRQGYIGKIILKKRLKKLWDKLNISKRFDATISRLQFSNEVTILAKIPNAYFIIDNSLSEEVKKLIRQNVFKGLKRKYRYILIYKNKNLLPVSDGIKNDLINYFKFNKKNINVIYNPVNFEAIKKLSAKNQHLKLPFKYIIHVARAIGQKRHDLLIDAWKLVNSQYKLVLLTDDVKKIESLVEKKEIQSKCVVLPFSKNPYPLMKHARLVVISSDFEGAPLVIPESIVCGTPIISTNCNHGPLEILGPNYKSNLVPKNNSKALSEKIIRELSNKKAPMKVSLERFDISNIVKKYENLTSKQSALLIKTKNIGDSIILTATINALPEYIKNIDVICLPESEGIFRMHPRINNIFVMPRSKTGISKIKSYFKLFSIILKKNYQFIFQFSNDWRGALIARYFNNAFSIARKHFKRGKIWDNSFSMLLNEGSSKIIPSAESDLQFINFAFGAVDEKKAYYYLNSPLNKNIQILDFLKANKKTIFFHTQSRWSFKELPNSTASKLINRFHNDNYQVILSGSKDDFENNIEIYNNCLDKPFVMKNPTLSETAAAMNLSDYVISIDSMTIHMASALKKPVIAIFGPTDDRVWGPYKTKFKVVALNESFDKKFKCRPCLNAGCANSKTSECLTEMPADYIFNQAINFINSLDKATKYS